MVLIRQGAVHLCIVTWAQVIVGNYWPVRSCNPPPTWERGRQWREVEVIIAEVVTPGVELASNIRGVNEIYPHQEVLLSCLDRANGDLVLDLMEVLVEGMGRK